MLIFRAGELSPSCVCLCRSEPTELLRNAEVLHHYSKCNKYLSNIVDFYFANKRNPNGGNLDSYIWFDFEGFVLERIIKDWIAKETFVMDTQQYFMGLSSRFTDFRKSNFLYDTILCVGEREFRVHGFLLASASKFFESLLQQYDKPEMKCIKLPRLDSNIMAIILDYIYTGKLFLPFNEETQKFEMPPNLIETFTELGIDLMEVDGHINILTYRRWVRLLWGSQLFCLT